MRTFAFGAPGFLECVCKTNERRGFTSRFPLSSFLSAHVGDSGGSTLENLSRRRKYLFSDDNQVNPDGRTKTIPCNV